MSDKNNVGKGIVLLAMLLGLLCGVMMAPFFTKGKKATDSRLGELTRLIEEEYVDAVDADSVQNAMFNGLLGSLDPHSHYFSTEELQGQEEEIRGGFDGVGIVLRQRNDTVWALQVLAGSPAANAGVWPGDRIVKVDTTTVSGVKMDSQDVVKRIRGMKGSVVRLSLLRKESGRDKAMTCDIVRGNIATPSVPYSGMLDARNGYIKVTSFSGTTYREFHEALRVLKSRGMQHLVIDLRGNSGGLLEAAIAMANDLLGPGELIVYTDGVHQKRSDIYSKGPAFYGGKVTIMVDEMSASASEVVSGAIQDNDRGEIVGRRTFGKGLVQRQFDMKGGSAVWLTVARYYTPSGRCIQRPYDKGSDEYYTSYLTRMLEEMESDSIVSTLTDSTKYYTKKGRVVYGGGGIVPDRMLSYLRDSDLVYYNGLVNNGCMNDVALDYVAANHQRLKNTYATEEDFVKNFKVDEALMADLRKIGEKKKVKYNAKSARKYDELIRTTQKAYVAYSLYGTGAFYKILVTTDHELGQVIDKK